jgi:hypothetical protein
MKTVRVSMDDDVYAELSQRAKKAGLHSVALLLLQKTSGSLSDSARAVNLVRMARNCITKQALSQSFEVKDLLSTVWEDLPTGVKLRVGKQFLADALSGNYNVKPAGKNSANHQLYRRTG